MTDAAIAWAQLLVSTPGSEAGLIGHAWPDCGDVWRMAEDVRFPPKTRQKRREQTPHEYARFCWRNADFTRIFQQGAALITVWLQVRVLPGPPVVSPSKPDGTAQCRRTETVEAKNLKDYYLLPLLRGYSGAVILSRWPAARARIDACNKRPAPDVRNATR
jgi:hypothetical protein